MEEVKALQWCSNLWTTWVAVLWNQHLAMTCKTNGQPNNSNQIWWIKGLDSETVIWGAVEEVTLVNVSRGCNLLTRTISLAIWVLEWPIKWIRTRCSMVKVKVDNVKCRIQWCNLNKVTETTHQWEERPKEIWATSQTKECILNNINQTSWAQEDKWDSTLNKTTKVWERACSVDSKTWWWADNNSGTTSNMGDLPICRTISWTKGS